jgi:hypothetical protein
MSNPRLNLTALERRNRALLSRLSPILSPTGSWGNRVEPGFEFLDKELQQVVRDAELGRRLADKLVKVWRIGGEEAWVLIHVEVQSQEETNFAERMYVYHYRIYDRYKRRVASIAILGDERSSSAKSV